MSSPVAISGLGTGLASQIDTQSLISKLVAVEQLPLQHLLQQQAACKSQVSALGGIASALSSLQAAAEDLSSGGVLGVAATSSNTAFAATPGSAAVAGSYDVRVDALASAAKWRSAGLASEDALQAGTMTVSAEGHDYTVAVGATDSLSDIANRLRATGAPVSATVLDDGSRTYLSITATQSGFSGADPASALAVSFTPTQPGDPGVDLTFGDTSIAAQNASFSIDDLAFTRRSNLVSDALPGVTVALRSATQTTETLTLENDTSATQARIQVFVDAYNGVMKLLQQQLDVSPTTNRTTTLAGDSTVRGLQQSLQGLVSSQVSGLGLVRTLADLGVATQRDGTLTVKADVLANAVAKDPQDVDAVFGDATTGLSRLASDLVDNYTAPTTGFLSIRQNGLNQQIRQMDDQATTMQTRLQDYQDRLTQQFAAMQSLLSSMQAVGDYLSALSNANSSRDD